jgi:hypothetical protein
LELGLITGSPRFLIDNGEDVNAKDNDGNTPLHHAREANVVKLLLSRGADPSVRSKQGQTPIAPSGCSAIRRSTISTSSRERKITRSLSLRRTLFQTKSSDPGWPE